MLIVPFLCEFKQTHVAKHCMDDLNTSYKLTVPYKSTLVLKW